MYRLGLPLLTLVLFLVFWEVAASSGQNLLVATFTETAAAFVRITITSGEVWPALLLSNQAALLGYAVAVVVAIPIGIAAGRYRRFDRVLNPYWAILLAVPIAPLMPVAITALGLTLAARVLVVFLFCVPYLIVNTRAGVRNVDPSLAEMARSYGANESKLWRFVVLPAAAPAIFAGLRICIQRAISGMVLAEILLVAVGVGRLLLLYKGRFQSDMLFALVVAIIIEALILLKAMGWLERRLLPWSA
jgi:NitT/TauT family transport system permease protein